MGSVRRRGGRIRVDLEPEETALLFAMTADVLDLLSDDVDADDPVESGVAAGADAAGSDSESADVEGSDSESAEVEGAEVGGPDGEASMADLLDATTATVDPPTDPVLRRLLPAAYRDDEEAAREFRRLTDSDLRATKRAALAGIVADISNGIEAAGDVPVRGAGTVPGTVGPPGVRLILDDPSAMSWLRALTDVRLTLGTRIGVTEDMDDERASVAPGSAREAELAVYDWLSWLQEALVGAVTGR
jgi:Domain of unknown function (DUF2017)